MAKQVDPKIQAGIREGLETFPGILEEIKSGRAQQFMAPALLDMLRRALPQCIKNKTILKIACGDRPSRFAVYSGDDGESVIIHTGTASEVTIPFNTIRVFKVVNCIDVVAALNKVAEID